MLEEVKIPEISENVESGTVVSVLVKVGDMIAVDDPVIELETDKALVEIPSPYAGRIAEIPVNEGDEVRIGDVIARVDTAVLSDTEQPVQPQEVVREPEPELTEEKSAEVLETEPVVEKASAIPKAEQPKPSPQKPAAEPRSPALRPAPASPSVRRLARELGVDIHAVKPAGPGERITEADVKAHVKHAQPDLAAVTTRTTRQPAAGEPPLPDFSRWGEIEAVDLATVRRITAESVATSWQTVPHVTQFDQADITVLEDFIRKNSDKVAKAG